ncbi:efflux RND transporter periplasmic adaptor subunit [Halomonas saccharevitans]|uniref:Efflux RND transporter periplasmic adaptor subunit n=1 Tax=Halomonas saccharevitans TaxID=416872 RepID=A0ABU3NHL6_9GAMM|nr:efflux RND transporter periplasmic adaptor subunit [Halomonas saccharevitans]MDT8880647.1 efflux RND transporter periplasmic adaptor subunit [Halomonas saccharevitans]
MPLPRRLPALWLLLAGLTWLAAGCSPEAGAPAAPPPTVVDSHVIQAGNGAAVTRLSGRVKAAERTSLSFEIPGEIRRLNVDVGERFADGDVLAELDDARYRLVADQRRAELQEAEAVLREKREDFRRHASLAEKGYVSQTRLDAARAALGTAESRRASARAALELAERDLSLTTLAAPFDGSVSRRQAEPSQRVGASQPVLEVISDREGFEVETSIPETLVGTLAAGSTHRVILPALGEAESAATLRHLGTQPRSSNDYPVILGVDTPPPGLRSGMTARVELSLDAREAASVDAPLLPVPMTALVFGDKRDAESEGDSGQSRAHVLRITEELTLERVAVEVVSMGEGRASVRGALSPGERIVARGVEFVRPGQTVSLLGHGPERYH